MIQKIKSFLRGEEEGATMVEYGLLLGLIALAAVTGVTIVGGGVNTMFTNIGNYLSGLPLP